MHKGFTLFELILCIVIIGMISMLGITSYQGMVANQALTYRAERVFYTLQLAQSEASKRNTKIYVHFCHQGDTWKMGLSETSYCDCFTSLSCQLDGVQQVFPLADGHRLFTSEDDISFSKQQASFGPFRFSVKLGHITLTNNQQQSLSVIQSATRLRLCSPSGDQLGQPIC